MTVNFDYAYGACHYASYHGATAAREPAAALPQRPNLTAYVQREGAVVRVIPGRTLGSRILAQFQAHLAAAQETHKLNLTFGSFQPFLAFFALSALGDDELLREKDLWFYRSMDRIAVSDLTTWCELCGLVNMFCISLIYDSDGRDPGPSFSIGGEDGVSLWVPVAGVKGTVTALDVFGLSLRALGP
ncbi:hypothetical protein DL764_006262 [Monosporascus ibericus]|uniref:Uncharacterized protein n=1 Tax=Monosporascus ibericus TaxID=155417 RepID=A0A4Q4T7B1_9PEZI|nr:hypothetical protein DL764_006262 [Monosporascus ibericus]